MAVNFIEMLLFSKICLFSQKIDQKIFHFYLSGLKIVLAFA